MADDDIVAIDNPFIQAAYGQSPPPVALANSEDESGFREALHDRVAVLEETNSFITAIATTPIVVAKEWVVVSGLELGPQNYEVMSPDLSLADDGASITVNRAGRYALSINCHFAEPAADGWFEAAVEPVGVCAPLWPDDTVNKGHVGVWVPKAMFSFPSATPGFATSIVAPLCAGDAITGSAKFVTANGTDSIAVTVVMFALRLGL